MIYVGFEGSDFEFLVNQESYDFFSAIIGFLIHENMSLDTKIVSLSIIETLVIAENVILLISMAAILKMASRKCLQHFHDWQHRFCCYYVTQERNKIGGYLYSLSAHGIT